MKYMNPFTLGCILFGILVVDSARFKKLNFNRYNVRLALSLDNITGLERVEHCFIKCDKSPNCRSVGFKEGNGTTLCYLHKDWPDEIRADRFFSNEAGFEYWINLDKKNPCIGKAPCPWNWLCTHDGIDTWCGNGICPDDRYVGENCDQPTFCNGRVQNNGAYTLKFWYQNIKGTWMTGWNTNRVYDAKIGTPLHFNAITGPSTSCVLTIPMCSDELSSTCWGTTLMGFGCNCL